MIKTHISLNVTDVSRSAKFYAAFFGQPPHKIRPGYANFDVADPPLKLALSEKPPQSGVGPLNHLGLLVANTAAVHAAKDRLKAAGLASFDEMDTTCCYAKQDKIWVHDPDGIEWEVYALTDDMLTAADLPLESACCSSDAEPGAAAPNDGHATPVDNSGVPEGRHR